MKHLVLLLCSTFASVVLADYHGVPIHYTNDNDKCYCIPLDECDDYNDGAGVINPRIGGSSPSNRCQNPADICCKKPKGNIYPQTNDYGVDYPDPHVPSSVVSSSCECVFIDECDDLDDGAGIINPRMGGNDHKRMCQNPRKICCKNPKGTYHSEVHEYDVGYHVPDPVVSSGCVCVPIHRCNDLNDGAGVINPRMGGDNHNTRCQNPREICCKDYGHVNDFDISYPDPHVPDSTIPTQCGERGIDLQDLHVYDNDPPRNSLAQNTKYGEFPWMVALLTRPENYICGGSLIHARAVLTAAHCVKDVLPSDLIARLGEWNTCTKNDHPRYHEVNMRVDQIKMHDRYNPNRINLWDDIAIVFLEEDAEPDFHINTVCLPQPDQVFNGLRCVASGWGKEYFGQISMGKPTLRKVDLPIIDRHSCEKTFKQTELGCRFCLHDTFMCAGGEPGKDMCSGDGGSPLVCFIDGHAVQVGIVAWGLECNQNVPGAYVDVVRYLPWIDKSLKEYEHNSHITENHLMHSSLPSRAWYGHYTYPGEDELRQCHQWNKHNCH